MLTPELCSSQKKIKCGVGRGRPSGGEHTFEQRDAPVLIDGPERETGVHECLEEVAPREALGVARFNHIVDVGGCAVPFEDFAGCWVADGEGAAEHPAVLAVEAAALVLEGVGFAGAEGLPPGGLYFLEVILAKV